MTAQWIEEVTVSCRASGNDYLDLIVDQAGLDFSVITTVNALSVQWQSLYQGLPEQFIVDDAPLLVRINVEDPLQVQWLQEISQQVTESAPLLLLCSLWSFSGLANWLTACVDILHEGRGGIFRFYDTRLFPLLFTHILTDEQQHALLQPVLFWAWRDMDGNSAGIKGMATAQLRGALPKKIELNDAQFEDLMCICDVMMLLSHRSPPEGKYSCRQRLFADCYQGMLEATKQGIITGDAREAWVIKKWQSEDPSQ